jgi:hypothetical protein
MKDFTKEQISESRPGQSVQETIRFCLERLFEDRKHCMTDMVCRELTYEELIGALLQAQDKVH